MLPLYKYMYFLGVYCMQILCCILWEVLRPTLKYILHPYLQDVVRQNSSFELSHLALKVQCLGRGHKSMWQDVGMMLEAEGAKRDIYICSAGKHILSTQFALHKVSYCTAVDSLCRLSAKLPLCLQWAVNHFDKLNNKVEAKSGDGKWASFM